MTFPLGLNPFAAPLKLYEVANKTYVRPLATDEVFFFDHLDGMYSYCTDARGNTVHLFCGEEVEIRKGFNS